MKINTFKQAEQFLALHIPNNSQQIFPGELGLKRAKYFLHLLGDPQEKLKIIHVAGTSGKGSTCYLISSLLGSQGFKVGLHQSPHLTDVRERFQIYPFDKLRVNTERSRSINGKIISQKEFVFYLNKIIPLINLVGKTFHSSLTYFEILVGLAFYIFAEKKVDYTVMETGLGGKFDATNVIERSDKLAVLTKIGLDHQAILGNTIEEIAYQKAMIINEKGQAISISQEPEAEKIIREVVKEKKAKLNINLRRGDYSLDPLLQGDDNPTTLINNLGLVGDYQKENASLALAAINYLSKRDGFVLDKIKIKQALKTAYFPGRFDIKKINNKTVIFDGAHNPQKMKAFISSLIKKYPDKKFSFLLAFKKGKDYQEMLKIIIYHAAVTKIIITGFLTDNQDMINASEEPAVISNQLNQLNRLNQSSQFVGVGFMPTQNNKLDIKIIPSLKKAWEDILKKKEPIVVTGSLYLIGEIYKLIKIK